MFKQILAPVAFEQSGFGAPKYAIWLAEQHAAELHVLHIVPDRMLPRFGQRNSLHEARQQLDQEPSLGHQVTIHRSVDQGSFTELAINYARANNIDLVVVDQAGAGLNSQRALETAVNRLIQELKCPVLVTKSSGHVESDALRRGVAVLREQFGGFTGGDHESTRHEMEAALAEHLSLSRQDADRLFAELESSQIVQWRRQSGDASTHDQLAGQWVIRMPEEVQFSPAPPETNEDRSAAIDLLRRAVAARATDVHIDPRPVGDYHIRFRIDGRMQEYCTLQEDVAGSVMKQLKVMANVSLADPFQPSESRLRLPSSLARYEVRITTAPVVNGEAIALRLIDCDKLYRPLNDLGLSATSFAAVYEMLHRRSGLVLISGPTGAGKTTTAYSMLNVLFTEQQNIVSIEDPVELVVPFMRQLSVDKRHGLTMDMALSTVLRMDPDVLFVGEIRTAEGAHVAMQAAGCGKRAFSTIHMRDCSATVTAMRKLDVDAKTLGENVSGIITQRLVRRLCTDCSQRGPITKHECELFESHGLEPPTEVLQPRGCKSCRNTGYQGRVGVFEAVVVDGDVAEAIRADQGEAELRELFRQAGTMGLVADGLLKVREGSTSMQEVQEMSWLPNSSQSSGGEYGANSNLLYERGAPFNPAR